MDRLEERRFEQRGREDLLREAAVQVQEVRTRCGIEVGEAARDPAARILEPAGARQRRRPGVEPRPAELGPQPLECRERDPAVGGQLPARDGQHAAGAEDVLGLAPRRQRLAAQAGENAQTGETGPDTSWVEHLALDSDRRFVEHARDVRLLDANLRRVTLVERVGRPEQQHPLPWVRKRDAHRVVRNRQRRRPGTVEFQQQVHALREAAERGRPRVLEGTNAVDPRSRRVHDRACLHGERLAREAIAQLRATHATRFVPERDHLRVVRDHTARGGGRAHVRKAEPAVVRERVDVHTAAAQAVEAEIGDALSRTRGRQQAADPVTGERRVQREPEPQRPRPVGAIPVEREQERQPADEVRRNGLEQRAALAMSLAHELDVAEAEIAKPTVDQLRRRARSRSAEVAAVDERDRKPGPRCLVRDPRADDPAADDEQVEPAPDERVEVSHSGFVQARQPAASVTSMRANVAPKGFVSRACVIQPASSVASTLPA